MGNDIVGAGLFYVEDGATTIFDVQPPSKRGVEVDGAFRRGTGRKLISTRSAGSDVWLRAAEAISEGDKLATSSTGGAVVATAADKVVATAVEDGEADALFVATWV